MEEEMLKKYYIKKYRWKNVKKFHLTTASTDIFFVMNLAVASLGKFHAKPYGHENTG
jgi:hypothetical protein